MKTRIHNLSIIIITMSLSIVGCNKENEIDKGYEITISDVYIENDNFTSIPTEVVAIAYLSSGERVSIGKGKIENWNSTLYLRDPLESIFLYPIEGFADWPNANFSTQNVLCYGAVSLQGYNKNINNGVFNYSNIIDESLQYPVHKNIYYFYSTEDVYVTGSIKYEGIDRYYKYYNLDLKKGWNRYVLIQTIYSDQYGSSSEYTTDIPDDLTWCYYSLIPN